MFDLGVNFSGEDDKTSNPVDEDMNPAPTHIMASSQIAPMHR